MQIALTRTLILLTWGLGIASFFVPEGASLAPLARTGRLVLLGLAVVHAIECVAFLPAMRKLGEPLLPELGKTFVFGVLHYASVRQRLDAREAETDLR